MKPTVAVPRERDHHMQDKSIIQTSDSLKNTGTYRLVLLVVVVQLVGVGDACAGTRRRNLRD